MMAEDKTPPAYVFTPYPAKRYHARKPAVYVQNEAEDRDLGPGWADHPSAFATPNPSKREA